MRWPSIPSPGPTSHRWFVLRDGQYELLAPDDAGVIRSETFPDLQLNVPALLAGDYATVVTEQFAANTVGYLHTNWSREWQTSGSLTRHQRDTSGHRWFAR